MQENVQLDRPSESRSTGVLLLTGAPGWLADRLISCFAAEPPMGLSRIRCLVHSALEIDAAQWARSLRADVEIVRADLADRGSLAAAVRGVSSVVHAAAIIHVERIADYYDINTEGTRRLTEAAAEAGVERMVLVSSNAAGGKSASGSRLLDEADPPVPLSHYGRSKLLAERAMFAVNTAMERVVLRPCMFYGPPVPARHVEIFKRLRHGRMPLVGGGAFARSLTHVDHLVQAVRLALTHPGAPGNTYYVADAHPYTTRQVVEGMARALGLEPRWIRLPSVAASIAYEIDTALSRLDRYWQTVHLVGEANWHVGVSIDRIRRELGYRPTFDIDDGMRAAVEWCRERKLV